MPKNQVSENRIIVNAFLFFDLEDDVADSALVHEAAHGLCPSRQDREARFNPRHGDDREGRNCRRPVRVSKGVF
jgi:hypothetical protein